MVLMEGASFSTFLFAALMLNIAPGPDMVYVMARSVGQGRLAGFVSAFGIFAGCLAHMLAAALGIAALLRSSVLAFQAIRYAGAAYLLYLGIRFLFQPAKPTHLQQFDRSNLRSIFLQGVVTNVLNPKVALFFLAFLPQFVDTKCGSVALQVVFLGMIFNTSGTLVNLAVAYAASGLGELFRQNPSLARVQHRLTGCVCVGLGIRVAISDT